MPEPGKLAFYSPDVTGRVTGGFLYNQQLLAHLRDQGWHIDLVSQLACGFESELDSEFESAAAQGKARLHLVDSLFAVDYMQSKHARPQSVFLYHLPPYAWQTVPQQWLKTEQQLLQAGRVVVTGTQCFDLLMARHDMSPEELQPGVRIITPGIADNWQRKTSFAAQPERLIVLASIVPQKGIAAIVDALSELRQLHWECHIYGETEQNPAFYGQMQSKIQSLELAERIQLAGTIAPSQVNRVMCQADLLINASQFETYSMVTAEAIATGLPILSTPVGEMQRFQQATNVQYLPGHEFADLHLQLHTLLTDPASYQKLCPNRGDSSLEMDPRESDVQGNTPSVKPWRDTARQWQLLLQDFMLNEGAV